MCNLLNNGSTEATTIKIPARFTVIRVAIADPAKSPSRILGTFYQVARSVPLIGRSMMKKIDCISLTTAMAPCTARTLLMLPEMSITTKETTVPHVQNCLWMRPKHVSIPVPLFACAHTLANMLASSSWVRPG